MSSRCSSLAAAFTATFCVAGCAVGPDFAVPPAPPVDRYTKEPLGAPISSSDVEDGAAQHFLKGRDLPGEWWRMFKSRELDALIKQALDANPNVQAALAALRLANET